jgi:hypothetical protein
LKAIAASTDVCNLIAAINTATTKNWSWRLRFNVWGTPVSECGLSGNPLGPAAPAVGDGRYGEQARSGEQYRARFRHGRNVADGEIERHLLPGFKADAVATVVEFPG